MACDVVKIADTGAIICVSGRHVRPRCCDPQCRATATKLCDHVMGNGKTCDAPICEKHADHVAEDLDFCPAHSSP